MFADESTNLYEVLEQQVNLQIEPEKLKLEHKDIEWFGDVYELSNSIITSMCNVTKRKALDQLIDFLKESIVNEIQNFPEKLQILLMKILESVITFTDKYSDRILKLISQRLREVCIEKGFNILMVEDNCL